MNALQTLGLPPQSADFADLNLPPGAASPRASDHHDAHEPAINALLRALVQANGSDLHLQGDQLARCRIHGEMVNLPGFEDGKLPQAYLTHILYEMVGPANAKTFEDEWDLDTAYELDADTRFRVNLLHDRGGVGAVLRVIPNRIKPFSELDLPESLETLTKYHKGLVLVTGPTGSGKSTTLAAMVDMINKRDRVHIVTLEDPIEFTHQSDKAVVRQREIGRDTASFAEGLRRVLREDPDVILLGELRDKETIETALTAAETGHLVFGTLHTSSAVETVSRIIGVFGADQQDSIRQALADSLMGVVCQTLCQRKGGGRVAALEVMMPTPAIRNNIRQNQLPQIQNSIATGADTGQMTLNAHLASLVRSGMISHEIAVSKSHDTKDLQLRMGSVNTMR